MIVSRFIVCSERRDKPTTRAVCDSRAEAEKALEQVRMADASDPEETYWIAAVGPETEAWRWLAPNK
jgi:hypothetical protein